jgi:beta-glucosidase
MTGELMSTFRAAIAACLLIFATGAIAQDAQSSRAWMNRSLSPEQRAELLVKAMTLEEKISQVHMMDDRQRHPREVIAIDRLGLHAFKISNGPLGAGPGDSREPQPATALPSAVGLAASWEPALAEKFGRLAAEELAARPEHLLEAPGVNIARVPQNGRNFEYFGEDPYLSSRLVVPETKGIQSAGILAEVKHYAANNQEDARKVINEIVDERVLREIYLPAFEASVKQGDVAAVMCAYPSVNGQFSCENVHLLKEILRGEWGFKGFVQSDYSATHSTLPAARAGLDLSMTNDQHYNANLKEAVRTHQLPESVVDTMLVRRFTQMFRFGFFDKTWIASKVDAKANGAVAREIAEHAAVLLKNAGNLLPLDAANVHSIALIGPFAGAAHTGGGGSSQVAPLYTVTPQDGLKNVAGANVSVNYNDGNDAAAAAAAAKTADVAIVMVGNRDREGADRPNLSLPNNQDQLVAAVAAANPRTIVVLKTGGPVLMPWINQVPAVLEAWYPGEEDGNAVANVLFGKVNPSGKLPVTFPKTEGDTPAHTPEQWPGVDGVAKYSEGLKVGYRWYDAENIEPLFAFGHGLSYTTFSFKNLNLPKQASAGQPLQVSVDVTNTGSRAGADVVQVYVAFPATAGEPPRQLKAFEKISLNPGETKHVTLPLDERAFSIWNTPQNKWTGVAGAFTISVGDSSRNLPLHADLTIQ